MRQEGISHNWMAEAVKHAGEVGKGANMAVGRENRKSLCRVNIVAATFIDYKGLFM